MYNSLLRIESNRISKRYSFNSVDVIDFFSYSEELTIFFLIVNMMSCGIGAWCEKNQLTRHLFHDNNSHDYTILSTQSNNIFTVNAKKKTNLFLLGWTPKSSRSYTFHIRIWHKLSYNVHKKSDRLFVGRRTKIPQWNCKEKHPKCITFPTHLLNWVPNVD